MSELAYFEYALVLPEERYLIEVQTHNPATGELRGQHEMESIAKECLTLVIGEGHEDVVKELKPNSISESAAQKLTRVQQLLTRSDTRVFRRAEPEVGRSASKKKMGHSFPGRPHAPKDPTRLVHGGYHGYSNPAPTFYEPSLARQ